MSTSLSKAIAISAIGWQKMLSESCSLEKALEVCLAGQPNEMKGVVQSLLYTTVRHRAKVELLLGKLVKKPPQENTKALLYIALALLLEGKEKAFTVVNQAVDAAKMNAETAWSSGFINAVLRNFLRSRSQLTASFKTNLSAQFNSPGWWISKVRQAYPNQWRGILSTQNKQPPLTVRVNRSKISVSDFLLKLEQNGLTGKQVGSWAVVIEPACPVNKIPGFFEGLCSIQDAGSQLVTELLTLKDGDRVLDACAAPGGKSAQLLETYKLDLTAMEIDPKRALRIKDTLSRLNLNAKIVVGDASDESCVEKLGDFDAIVLDAPCTASGIVRRHPDIVWSRRPEDVALLAQRQRKILETLWKRLPSGKDLLYIVCSVFPEEGPEQIKCFLEKHPEAHLKGTPLAPDGVLRLLPTEQEADKNLPTNHDGFFYALLTKRG
ncbi:16S rRNA (cytosine(967)-C(5))-methyltransferase RsmB [Parasutterella secunda]|uniref:16S rRNA (cytosine(967)-C(5))-methyltransferase RsmB n=1 Tax=Parasutterella secunda TaxID=626947 RepID=UPI0025A40BBA|nr:16S rRNA (cytosine(967)-C(5))-methyltransferase RsmB [Parasutterella secunda]MDM8112293.1 16S rRNA (cytosine(967)-C(5))-methyltransferase RsmB [Parasutterella secunda]MDM8217587.1 16S rRNA (cytosine(967)-C(5))-methyltransferase RsmB [Parasutterella secunda]